VSLQQLIADCQARVNQLLNQQLPAAESTPSRLHQAMRYSALDAGKRLRPLLVYACGNSFSAEQADLDACALAIECIHVYSLIHDDLPAMDDDDLRRGKATCHIEFDEATAILAGDALQSLAFELLIKHPFSHSAKAHQLAMLETLAVASGSIGMGGGQMIDLEATGKQQTLDDLQQMHRMKTGALIQASIRFGYLAANITEPDITTRLDKYSDLIGLAFQVKDDILDVEADTETLGKPSGSDQAANKSTFVALMGLAGAKAYASQLVKEAKLALTEIPTDTARLEQIADFIISRKH
jgi:farnesyl diphosphate synthase